jgi:hypothetical protein
MLPVGWWAVDSEQERRIELVVAALRLIDVYGEEELAEARERLHRVQTDPVHQRIADQRVQGGSGP